MKKKIRFGMGISTEEYCPQNRDMARDFIAECLTHAGYLGFFETWDGTLRVFTFEKQEQAECMVKEAKRIGFATAGMIEGLVIVSNEDLQRPHLQNIRNKYSYYKEYYR